MRIFRRPVTGWGNHNHPAIHVTPHTGRPVTSAARVRLAPQPATMSGPAYKGMDPSDPLTHVRTWNPQPGMISFLNFDGAAAQSNSPTGGVARGRQSRRRG